MEHNSQNKKFTIKVQRLSSDAKLPNMAYDGDAAYDIYSNEDISLTPGNRANIKTGIKMAIPRNYAGLIWDKGGIANSGIHTLGGVVDSGYRGEIMINLVNLGKDIYNIVSGQKIAQMIIQKIETPKIIETEIDDKTDRDEGGFGSSGLF